MKLKEFTILEGARIRYPNGDVKPLSPEALVMVEILRELQTLNGRLAPHPAPPPATKKEAAK